MKAVVTGATGFLGSVLVHELVNNGCDVTAIVRPDSRRMAVLDGVRGIKRLEIPLERSFSLPGDKYDVFYHLAWGGGRNNFDEQYANLDITVNCMKAATEARCRRFICTGSQAEYGETTDFITEDTPLNPVNAYGAAKVAAYYLCKNYLQNSPTDLIWARVFSVYGEHDAPHTLYSRLVDAAQNGRDFTLSSDGTHMWNYLHEDDAARALRLLADERVMPGVYNVASRKSRPLREYVEEFKNAIDPDAVVKYGTEKCPVNLYTGACKIRKVIGEFEN